MLFDECAVGFDLVAHQNAKGASRSNLSVSNHVLKVSRGILTGSASFPMNSPRSPSSTLVRTRSDKIAPARLTTLTSFLSDLDKLCVRIDSSCEHVGNCWIGSDEDCAPFDCVLRLLSAGVVRVVQLDLGNHRRQQLLQVRWIGILNCCTQPSQHFDCLVDFSFVLPLRAVLRRLSRL